MVQRLKKITGHTRGFTLLEMIIALGIFTIVMMTAVSILLFAQNAQRKARNLQNVQDNIRFTLEFMTKELRTGEQFGLCNANTKIVFINDLNTRVSYWWDSTNLQIRREEYPALAGTIPTCANTPQGGGIGGPITTNEVQVDRMLFHPQVTVGVLQGPNDGQPRFVATFRIRARNTKLALDTMMDLQTTITTRLRDDQP